MKHLHREDIKAGIRKKYGSLSAFEKSKGLPTGSARDVLRGKSVSGTATVMADVLGVDFKAISPNQKRIKTRSADNSMSANVDLHRLNEGGE